MLLSRGWYYLSSIPTLLLGVESWPKLLSAFAGWPVTTPFVITLRNGLRFKVRTFMDVWIIKETCLDLQYERTSVYLEDGWIVVDIGAGLGDFAVSVAKKNPRSTVYAYEPLPESFALLKENLLLNETCNVLPFPYAVGKSVGNIHLYAISAEAVQQSTVARKRSVASRSVASIEVPSVTLNYIFDENKIKVCDYLKMDCEGAEYEILFSTDESTLQKIRHLCLEYHDGVTEFSHYDLVRFLEQQGFRIRLTPNPAHSHLGFLYGVNYNS